MKKNKLSKIIQLVILLGLGIFFVWFSMRKLTPEDVAIVKDSAKSVLNARGLLFITLCILCSAAANYVRGLRNILMIEPLGYKVRKSVAFYSVMTCYLANLAFPRLGEVLRCTFLQRYENVPFQKSLGTIVTERSIDLIVWLFFFIIIVLINSSLLVNIVLDNGITLGDALREKINGLVANPKLYIGIVLLIVLCLTIFFTRKWWSKKSFFVKIANFFKGIIQGIISIKDLQKPWLFVIETVLIWILYFLGTYCCFFAFPFLQHLGAFPAFTVLIFSTIAFMISQGGLGAYPLMVASILILYGINYSQGLAAGWIGWSAQTLMSLVFGSISLILASFLNPSKNEKIVVTDGDSK